MRILLVDPDRDLVTVLATSLKGKGHEVTVSRGSHGGLPAPARDRSGPGAREGWDAVVLSPTTPETEVVGMLRELRSRTSSAMVLIAAHVDGLRRAFEAMTAPGASTAGGAGGVAPSIRPSPPDGPAALEPHPRGRDGGAASSGAPCIIGRGEAMRSLLRTVGRLARLPVNVLIEGESGTGKELIARAIHASSPRANGRFLPVNCAAILPSLAESLLFGHRKGAFTGADADRPGYFQAAAGGTLFLDELSDLPAGVQGMLLRPIEERTATPIGSSAPDSLDVRIVSASNRHLAAEVREGRFRPDLYYRLNVVRVVAPPLRDHAEDIEPLVDHFLGEFERTFCAGPLRLDGTAMTRLLAHSWPGNVRELRNVLERAFVLCDGEVIEARHLPAYLRDEVEARPSLSLLDAAERRQIQTVLASTGGQKKAAAMLLGIGRSSLYRKLKRLGLEG